MAGDCSHLVVAGKPIWYPYSIDADGKQSGAIGFVIARKILTEMHVEMTIRDPLPWSRVVNDVESGAIDLAISAYWNAQRAFRVRYTEPYATEFISVFSRSDQAFHIDGYADLIGRQGVRELGSNFGDDFETYAKANLALIETANTETLLRMVQSGRVDYAVISRANGLMLTKALQGEPLIVPLVKPIANNKIHMMFSRKYNCPDIVDGFNRRLKEMRDSGEIDRMLASAKRDGS